MTDSNNITDTNVTSIEKEEKQTNPSEIKQENASLDDAASATDKSKQLTTCDAFVESITQNYKSWVCMFVAIYLVSKPNLIEGYFTFGVMLLFSYYIHKETHAVRNFLTIAHHYHHEHNNFISNFVQILLEFQAGCGLNMLFHYLLVNFHKT